ncbi:MAG: hypothetical protein HC855_14490, partial [Rhizobiales bacterium]|nr:hypothetical protein [Hyphomicrobiales bacterium]
PSSNSRRSRRRRWRPSRTPHRQHRRSREECTKKKGLFERLASVGLGRKDDPVPATPKEPTMTARTEPKIQASNQGRAAQAPAAHIDQNLDDDQLEIPAFLRRQAN